MTSSNKVRRYLQHHKQSCAEPHNSHQSTTELLIIDPTTAVTSMRKFRAKIQQQPHRHQQSSTIVSVPQIFVDNDDDTDNKTISYEDDSRHEAILDEFDEVLENELKRTSLLRTSSLKHKESNNRIGTSLNQQRNFSFAFGSSTNLDEDKHSNQDDECDNCDATVNTSSFIRSKLPSTLKSSLSKETFLRLLHSLAFRTGNHTTSKITMTVANSPKRRQQQSCLACQSYRDLDFPLKYKKRPSIFGVLVSKLNTTTTMATMTTTTTTTTTKGNNSYHCPACKRHLSKSTFYGSITSNNDDENQQSTQNFSSSSLAPPESSHDHEQLFSRTKRRRSLPSLLQSFFDSDHQDKHRVDNTRIQHRPSLSSIFTHSLLDGITHEQQQQQQQQQANATVKQKSSGSYSSISLARSDDSKENNHEKSFKQQSIIYDDSSQLTEKVSKSAKTFLSLVKNYLLIAARVLLT